MHLSSYTLYSIDWRHIKIKIDVIYYIKDTITYLLAITYTRVIMSINYRLDYTQHTFGSFQFEDTLLN